MDKLLQETIERYEEMLGLKSDMVRILEKQVKHLEDTVRNLEAQMGLCKKALKVI